MPPPSGHRPDPSRPAAAWRAAGLALLLALLPPSPLAALPSNGPRVPFTDSIREVPTLTPGATRDPNRAAVVRATLSAAEAAAPIDVEVALRMRNFAELQARVAHGEIIPSDELAAKYFPLPADYVAVTAWLQARGLTITRTEPTGLSVFARGTVQQLEDVFQMSFARVAFKWGEYTSAVTAPSLPTSLAAALVGINGLQPHLRPHKLAAAAEARPFSLTSNRAPYIPSQILKAYSANGINLDGTGETIAIVIDTFPADSDLTTFWTQCGVSQSLNNITKIQVINGSLAGTDPSEATIDAELTSSLAPGAKIRIYATTNLDPALLSQAYQEVYNDAATNPGLHQLDLSYGINEDQVTSGELRSDGQIFAALAARGVTICASSGDGGSNPNASTGSYSATAAAQPSHPASDPSVTAVGATTLVLDLATGQESSETGWSVGTYSGGQAASGGGVSRVFTRPTWQTGPGVPSGTMRLVPDVSSTGDPSDGCYIVVGGKGLVFGGTSVSAPTWTGFCALLNQARAAAGLDPIGLLGPKIYPLIGTTSLRDITSGNNGIYTAGAGYDLVTGVGVPIMSALVPSLAPASPSPAILIQPVSLTIAPGQDAVFSLTATGSPLPSYQWQRETAGTSTWANLGNGSPYAGATSGTLTVSAATTAMSGDLFQCVVTNTNGTATSAPAALVVSYPLVVTTLAGSAGNSGSTDGTGTAARFTDPADVTVDGAGNVYVSDTNDFTIRKITPAGTVTTLAGQAGARGSTDGTASAARFNHPTGIAVDGAGNVYVADTDNETIRKITAAGVVTTVAGQAGRTGSADGTGTAAQFASPSDVNVDTAGNLYVADADNNTIRRITPAGVVTTFAGVAGASGSTDGTGAGARFSSPEGVTVDSAGNLYVADTNNQTIRKITPAGAVTTLAGAVGLSGGADGPSSVARFQDPSDLTVDGVGNIYVADTDNHAIRKITPAGAVATVAGTVGTSGSSDGMGTAARFFYPTGVAADAGGNVYLADTDNHTVRKAAPVAAPVITVQPQSQSVDAGTNVTFSVTATGVPAPTYQWYNGSAPIGAATSSTYSLNNAQPANAGSYSVVVSNLAGSVTSSAATLTVAAVSTAVSTPSASSSGGGGGGGGALAPWFVAAFFLLGALRRAAGRRSAPQVELR